MHGLVLAQLLFLDLVRLLGISAGIDSVALVSDSFDICQDLDTSDVFSPFWIYRSSSTTQIRTIDFGNRHIAIESK
jgi:hypothetical protein